MRKTDLSEINFPIREEYIYRKLDNEYEIIDNSVALINSRANKIISLVSKDYKIITNEEAISLGKKCFKQLFPKTDIKDDEIEIFNIIAPSTHSFCHIDLIHKFYSVNIWNKEVFIPFIRVTNSYNKTYSLRFDIGFSRKICDNGCIFENETIKFHLPHSKKYLKENIEFKIGISKLENLENQFKNFMESLHNIKIEADKVDAIICKSLSLLFDINNKEEKVRKKAMDKLQKFQDDLKTYKKKYLLEKPYNAYDIYNIITDYASNKNIDENMSSILTINSSQKRIGNWIITFIDLHKKGQFSYSKYLENELKYFKKN